MDSRTDYVSKTGKPAGLTEFSSGAMERVEILVSLTKF